MSVTAIDRSKEMQEEGQKRAAKYHVKIDSIIQDVHQLPFPDNSFDVITLQGRLTPSAIGQGPARDSARAETGRTFLPLRHA